ncbi:succinate dehydrogenase, hydrophobic membrane anchor protein [Vannielia litorea]|uniref:succinate dehydrogenase, hydrophobic membrane anchor protein n=1 Tax=Vannielia litorea TaxID=1217970 RepID=UPI001BCEE57C|nr:succinate dehydrogenase, hydrophobic membrane anchor protein [Vannielia litorea]MBS8226945.1 succinate dehydrogenase, hydrophobic membrane anchor protein [Vannielia litorea]
MAFLTDRKRAEGMGSAKSGTEHHWHMQISSYALVILTPLFLLTFGPQLGNDYETVIAHFARPWPAIICGLMVVVGMWHFRQGFQAVIDDYVSTMMTRKLCIIALACFSYGVMAAGVFALVKLAL